MIIKGYAATDKYLIDSDGNKRDSAPFLNWLLEDTESVKVCYDLDAFASCVFRLIHLTLEEAKTLQAKEKLTIDRQYEITYFAGRYLSIAFGKSYNRPYVQFYDMSRYILPMTHNPDDDVLSKAVQARDIALQLHKSLNEIGGGIDTTAIGSITKAMKPIMAKLSIPNHLDVPTEVVKMALENVKGNWVEAFKVGYIKEAYDYDMSSAYASFLANLPDLRLGDWAESRAVPGGALLGFASGRVTRRSSFSPLIYRSGDSLHGKVGSWDDVLNLDEIKFIQKWGADDFSIDNGRWWIPNAPLKYPYRGLINWLWQKRQASQGITRDQIKRIMAYLWGQTLADYGSDFGELYNPIYGAYVESGCRLKVADFVLSNNVESNLCHVAVDGVLLDTPVLLQDKQGMGEWRLSYQSQAIIVNSAYVFVEGKAGPQEFAHSFEWLKPAIEANPGLDRYARSKYAVVSLAQSVLNNDVSRLGELELVSEDVVIGSESKRFYLEMPRTGGELLKGTYNSKPASMPLALNA